jgi:hypothetical protein
MGEAAIRRREAEHPQQYVFTVTDGGFAKKTVVEQYRLTTAAAWASRRPS